MTTQALDAALWAWGRGTGIAALLSSPHLHPLDRPHRARRPLACLTSSTPEPGRRLP